MVKAGITLPASFVAKPPKGGIRLRIRAPTAHAGQMSRVAVGGKPWTVFNAIEETVDIAASKLTPVFISDLATIEVAF